MEKRVELVISIPERSYEIIKNGNVGTHPHNTALLCSWIKNGTPLPPGHGRLIDESKIDWLDSSGERFTFEKRIKNTSDTIVDADKDGE